MDLLLSLIEEQKLNITEIAIAEVTEQFLKHVRSLEQLDPTSLADYLNIAAKLLVIKSRAILPSLEVETDEEDIALDLTEKLLLYKQFKEVAKHLKQLDSRQQQSFTRVLQFEERVYFFPDPTLSLSGLHSAILRTLNSLKELDNLPKAKIREVVSIQEKIEHIQHLLTQQIETKLSTIIASAKNKSEIIITFLALLELTKQKILTVEQEALFTDVTIKKYQQSNPDPGEVIENADEEIAEEKQPVYTKESSDEKGEGRDEDEDDELEDEDEEDED